MGRSKLRSRGTENKGKLADRIRKANRSQLIDHNKVKNPNLSFGNSMNHQYESMQNYEPKRNFN